MPHSRFNFSYENRRKARPKCTRCFPCVNVTLLPQYNIQLFSSLFVLGDLISNSLSIPPCPKIQGDDYPINGLSEMQSVFRNLANYLNKSTAVQRFRVYNRIAFSPKYLLFTNVCISISLSSVGDCLEQQYEIFTNDLDKYSGKRTAHMALSGSTVGVVCHYWYKFLDKRMPGRSLKIVLKKVFWDQLICSPIVISTFFLTLGVLEQSSREEIVAEIKSKAWKLYAAEWVVWPPAQIINFYWLPNKYRVLYDNTISLGYDVYTSKVKHAK